MTPSWYDVLGIDPTASEAEVRRAWKAAIADLDPSDRRFRAANQAAEVLLDPERRAAHDATLEAEAEAEPEATAGAGPEVGPEPAAAPAAAGAAAGPRRSVPAWLIGVAALLALASVVAAAVLWRAEFATTEESVEDAARAAQAVAERAVVPLISYDHRTMAEDRTAALSYLTEEYGAEYEKLFAVLEESADDLEVVVEAEVLASGIVRADTDRVQVLLFVDRPTIRRGEEEPTIYKDQVTVTMEKVGDDWLVDQLSTTPLQD
ncbi:J domain-containing protein [Nocardioides sp. SYSU DS0663]|uniref:J domain-containing protein n=1 Tax=Nocardioides sp. SYSU DS0663 TaxID=3416445 RepID=UPI003F4B2046